MSTLMEMIDNLIHEEHVAALPEWTGIPLGQLVTDYPAQFRIPGAPIITERGKYGTRHVIGYSPYGGYDLSAPLEEEQC